MDNSGWRIWRCHAVNKAFQYSSLASVALLDCWTIPWVIILTWIFLGARYSIWQFFGAALCVVGLCLVLLSDVGIGGEGGSRPLLGDTLVIAATLCIDMSNVGEEFYVKKKDRVELLSMLGLFGLLVSVCEIEKDSIPSPSPPEDGNISAEYQVLNEDQNSPNSES